MLFFDFTDEILEAVCRRMRKEGMNLIGYISLNGRDLSGKKKKTDHFRMTENYELLASYADVVIVWTDPFPGDREFFRNGLFSGEREEILNRVREKNPNLILVFPKTQRIGPEELGISPRAVIRGTIEEVLSACTDAVEMKNPAVCP